jgi:hypothetical protein
MSDGRSTYYFFRYFLHPMRQLRINWHGAEPADVRDLLSNFFVTLEHDGKISCLVGEREFLLYLIRTLGPDILVCKFARGLTLKRHQPGERDIESVTEPNYPYIYVVIDRQRQILMLQKKTTVFRSIDQASSSFRRFLLAATGAGAHEISINDITSTQHFWKCIEEAEAVYYVMFRLKAPNLLGFSEEAATSLRRIKESVNNTAIEIKLEHEDGYLRIQRENDQLNLGSLVDYASGGGGSWGTKIRRKGELSPTTVTSKEFRRGIQLLSNLEHEEPERIIRAMIDADKADHVEDRHTEEG